MAYAASTVKVRYIVSGSIPILKNDFINICNDLIALQTFQATATDQVGKFTKILLAGASAGASSLTSGGAVSEIAVTPATNIPLHHLDVSSLAATNVTNRGRWKQLLLAETAAFPNTNIQLRDISTTDFIHTSTDGHWKKLSLGSDQTSSSTLGGLPFTNIGIRNLKGATVRLNTTFQTSGSITDLNTTPRMFVLGNITSAVSSGSARYHMMAVFLTTVAGTVGVSTDYMYAMGGSTTSSSAATNYLPMVLIKTSGADGATQLTFECRVIELSEI